MKTKFTRAIPLLLALTMVLSLTACGGQSSSTAPMSSSATPSSSAASTSGEETDKPATHVLTDAEGRQVELPNPVTRAVVSNAYNTELIKAIGAIDRVVGVSHSIYADRDCYSMFNENQVISTGSGETNYEKIVELNPEVFILPNNGGYEEAIEQLTPFGIKVFVVNCYFTDQFEMNCQMLGDVFGEQEKAQYFCDYFMDKLDYINTQLEGVEKKRLYFEYRNPGTTTVPGDYFFNMVEYSHAENLFKTATNKNIELEAVIDANPDYIFKVSQPEVPFVYTPPTVEDHKAIHDEICSRPGWDEITAVKEDNIFLISGYGHGGASKLVGTMYLAKFLYPEQLPDLHPEQIFKDWQEQFQQLEYTPGHTYPALTVED